MSFFSKVLGNFSVNAQLYSQWPNERSERFFLICTNTLLYKIRQIPLGPVRQLNALINLLNVVGAVKQKEITRIALNILAVSALLHPEGLKLSMAMSCIAELENLYSSNCKARALSPFDVREEDITREKAIEMLKLSERYTQQKLEEKYQEIKQTLEERKTQVTLQFVPTFEKMLSQLEKAYKILKTSEDTSKGKPFFLF